MKLFYTPAGRISLAVVLSVLLHAAIYWLPNVELSREKMQLPPLTVKLQLLPKTVLQTVPIPEVSKRAFTPDDKVSENSIIKAVESMNQMERSEESHSLPNHLVLIFNVYKGSDIFKSDVVYHQLDINNNKYSLKAIKQATGVSNLNDDGQFIQTSQGEIGELGLRPDVFMEEKIIHGRKQNLKAVFDWPAQKLHFSRSGADFLSADAQDVLSYMYQFSQLSMNSEIVSLSISDGAHLEKYRFEIGRKRDLTTPMGNLSSLRLRKMHSQNEPYFEIWLALEYRMLPVKLSQFNGSGEVIEEWVISDIRSGDDE